MKHFFTLLTALGITTLSLAQPALGTSTTATNIVSGGRAWSQATNWSTQTLNNGNQQTDYLSFTNFGLTVPANISIQGVEVQITRSSGSSATLDSAVRLVINGGIYFGADATLTNGVSIINSWPAAGFTATYTLPADAVNALTPAIINSANFGVAIRGRYNNATNSVPTVTNSASIRVNYIALAPIILTDFTVTKNSDNHAVIKFSTASEENVQSIFIERSTDGRNFEKIFTIAPKGARNVFTSYVATDKAPAAGNNYYRISEIDKDGRQYQYLTKLLTITRKGASFGAYFNGGQVVASISNIPGTYDVSVMDMSGITIARKTAVLNSGNGVVSMDAPSRSGIYIVNIKGQGVSEAIRVAVNK